MMKRNVQKTFVSCITVLAMLCSFILPHSAALMNVKAYEYYGHIGYYKENDHIVIWGMDEPLTKMVIPSEIDGLPVTVIGSCRTASVIGEDEPIEEVIIPEGVTTIHRYAFNYCKNLRSVTLPSTLTTIEESAFQNCSLLDNVKLPSGLVTIEQNAFESCISLSSITIPASVEDLGGGCFANTSCLETVTIEEGCAAYLNYTFLGSGCKECIIPASITGMDDAFSWELEKITVLNPECEIEDIVDSIYRSGRANFHLTVYGYSGSTAQTYVESQKYDPQRFTFVSLGSLPPKPVKKDFSIETYSGTVNVELTESLFRDTDALDYNKQLATLGIALSTAAYDSDGEDGMGNNIRRALKDNMECDRYRLYSYPNADENNPNGLKGLSDNTYAFSIADKQFGDTTVMFITLRGSAAEDGSLDWEKDILEGNIAVDYHGSHASKPFSEFADDVQHGIQDYMNSYPDLYDTEDAGKLRVFVSGHSLGGAGTCLTGYLINAGFTALADIPHEDVYIYSYAAPNTLFIPVDRLEERPENYYAQNIINIINVCDLVPTVPLTLPSVLGYEKALVALKPGNGYCFDSGEKMFQAVPIDIPGHHQDRYINAIKNDQVKEDSYTRLCIACPVNVEVYHDAKLVGRVVRNEVDESVTVIPMAVLDDQKLICLPDDSYEVRITSYDTDQMDFTAVYEAYGIATVKSCQNITLTEGKTMTYTLEEGASVSETPLLVKGTTTLQIQQDGSEIPYVPNALGDINGDTVMNASDAARILIAAAKIGAGDSAGLATDQKTAADVNSDGSINASDAAIILIYAAAIGAGQDVNLNDFVK